MLFSRNSGFRIFSVAGIDVLFSTGFIFLVVVFTIITVVQTSSIGMGVAWAASLILSLLIHEFGHAVVSKYYKLHPNIVLHTFGGTCFSSPATRDLHDFFITAAGPLVQIIAGVAALLVSLFLLPPTGVPLAIESFFSFFTYFSIVWGGINLFLPIYPLDGGRIFLLIMRNFVSPTKGEELTYKVSLVLSVAGAICFLFFQYFFFALLAAFIAYENYQRLQMREVLIQRFREQRSHVKALATDFKEIEKQFSNGNWKEASRLCHVLRGSSSQIPESLINRVWYILGVSAINLGEYQEALEWLSRAPQTNEVKTLTNKAQKELELSVVTQ